MNHDYYLNMAKQDFLDLYDRNSKEFSEALDNLLRLAQVAGSYRERYRILDQVRNKSLGIVVEAFENDTKKFVELAGRKLAQELESQL